MFISKYWTEIKKQNNPLKFVIAKILIRLRLSHLLKIKLEHYVLKFYPSVLSRGLWIDKKYNHSGTETEEFVCNYLKTDDKVIDIGSNIGTVTLEAATKVGELGKVYSFEAHPQIFKYLLGNIKVNRLENIKAYNLALGDKNDKINFSNIKTDDSNRIVDKEGIKIQMIKLDDLPITEEEFALMKIDVLGYEKFVFSGAEKILKITKCIHFPFIKTLYTKYGYDGKETLQILKTHGFQIFKLSNKIIQPISKEFISQPGDLLAIKDLNDFVNRTNFQILKN